MRERGPTLHGRAGLSECCVHVRAGLLQGWRTRCHLKSCVPETTQDMSDETMASVAWIRLAPDDADSHGLATVTRYQDGSGRHIVS